MIHRTNLALVFASALLWGCGASGEGPDGRTLSTTVSEDAGANCPNGGQRILTGVDANGNGALEAAEILQVAYVCDAAPPSGACAQWAQRGGGSTLTSVEQWNALADLGCTVVGDDLVIDIPGDAALLRPSPLVRVGGLQLGPSATLTRLAFPALTTVDRSVDLSDSTVLAEVELPSLLTVGEELRFFYAPALARLELPALTGVGGVVWAYQTSLAALSLPRLASADQVVVGLDAALTSLELPALAAATGLSVYDNPLLAELAAPSLTALTRLEVRDNAALASIDLPALARLDSGYPYPAAQVAFNPALAAFRAPALRTLGALDLDVPAPAAEVDLGSLEAVTEELLLGAARAARLDLPRLATADHLSLWSLSAVELDLGALTTVTRGLSISVHDLEALRLPELTSVGWGLAISSAGRRDDPQTPQDETGLPGRLARVELPKLSSVVLDLAVVSQALAALEAPALAQAGGVLIAGGGPISRLDLPALGAIRSATVWRSYPYETWTVTHSASGDLRLEGNPGLAAVEAPLLARIDGDLAVTGADALVALRLPVLGIMWGEVDVSGNAALTSLSLPALAQARSVLVTDDPALVTLELPALWRVFNRLAFSGLDRLPALSLPALAESYSSGFSGSLAVTSNAALASVSAPALTAASTVTVIGNPALATVSLPSLAAIGALQVTSNDALTALEVPALTTVRTQLHVYYDPRLPQCQALAVQARLLPPFPTDVSIAYNDLSATCP